MIAKYFLILTFAGFISNTQAITIKLGTLAPINSPWYLALGKLASDWINLSDGKVNIKIYPGGVAGNEEDMIRKMRLGQLQAAALSIIGASRIYSGAKALSWPRLIHTSEEAVFVLQETSSFLNQKMEEKGFITPLWSFLGWTHIFSRNPIQENTDLMEQKLMISDVNIEEVQAWQKAGFDVMPLPTMEIMVALQSKMIDAYITSPTAAFAFQWFGNTPYMHTVRFAPLYATLVVTKKTWEKIPKEYHGPLLTAAQETAQELMDITLDLDQKAINMMQSIGLQVQPTTPKIDHKWEQIIKEYFYPELIQTDVIDSSAYEYIREALMRYRNEN